MQKDLDQNSKGGITQHKKKKRQKTKEDYNLRDPKVNGIQQLTAEELKKNNIRPHSTECKQYNNQYYLEELFDPEKDKIAKQKQESQIRHAQFKAYQSVYYNMENQARQQNHIIDLLQGGKDPAFSDTYNPNAVINEPANDLASRAIPWGLLIAQNKILSGNSSRSAPQIGYETDLQSGTSTQDPDVQQTDQDAGGQQNENISQQQKELLDQAKLWAAQLIQDNNETKKDINKLEIKTGATDWGQPAINAAYTNNPYPVKKTGYYMNQGRMPSLMQKKEIYDKSSKINKPKERMNYIKTSQLMKSAAAQEALKKYGKNKKKK
ncbi:MAG: hypothetical protein EZS28_007078 [Streblomastix strix]|uniref:Uncharacterized protein n=1 Tax=Streblomastix strix TaxID=222440 RepID=A0A5J4WR27_9EUKA|nr:MAG: hypothetical protein EZS28_007078 [Streblomastix strix]